MRIARRAGLDQEVALAAQARPDEVLMHRAGDEQRMRGQPAAHEIAVGNEEHELAVAHGSLRLCA